MPKKIIALLCAGLIVLSLAACGSHQTPESSTSSSAPEESSKTYGISALDTSDQFSERDLEQKADLSEAVYYNLNDNTDIMITDAGVYVVSGSAENVTVIVDAEDKDKVQIVLDGVTIENEDSPCIYCKNADKLFLTTTDSENSLSVTGNYIPDVNTTIDAVIFSKDDLVLNGSGTLDISSTENGITGKDDLKITGGSITINCVSDALEANDSIRIAGGSINITADKDGLHAENDDDDTRGYIYISGGTLDIKAEDDAIHGTIIVQIDGGDMNISAREGIEATWVQINEGTINITATDDGINAGKKSTICTPTIEFNGGTTSIQMGNGDTDAVDSNGDLYINGGTIDITARSPFDYDGAAEYNGGSIIVNGQLTNSIDNQFAGDQGAGGKGKH